MTGEGSTGPVAPGAGREPFRKQWALNGPPQGPLPESVAWSVVSTLMSGLLGFGLPAWLLDRWLGTTWIVLIGLLVGMAAALTVIWFRYGTERTSTRPTGPRAAGGRDE